MDGLIYQHPYLGLDLLAIANFSFLQVTICRMAIKLIVVVLLKL
jgi:hypothetical protein